MNEFVKEQLHKTQHETNLLRESVSCWCMGEDWEIDYIFHNIERINCALEQIRRSLEELRP